MLQLAQRLQRELDEANVTYKGQKLRFGTSFGVASLSLDPVNAIEELMRLAVQRLQAAAKQKAPAVPEPSLPRLPAEVDRALQVLEGIEPARLGKGAKAVLKRLEHVMKVIQVKKH
jgi:GGDEF domain-containing protein